MMLLEMAAQAAPERVAIGPLDGGLTYGRLYELAGGAATWLRAQPAERVLYTDVSTPALPVAVFGSSWGGTPFAPLNYRLADDRLRWIVERQAPAVLLHGPDGGARTAGIAGVEPIETTAFLDQADTAAVPDADWSYDPDD